VTDNTVFSLPICKHYAQQLCTWKA